MYCATISIFVSIYYRAPPGRKRKDDIEVSLCQRRAQKFLGEVRDIYFWRSANDERSA